MPCSVGRRHLWEVWDNADGIANGLHALIICAHTAAFAHSATVKVEGRNDVCELEEQARAGASGGRRPRSRATWGCSQRPCPTRCCRPGISDPSCAMRLAGGGEFAKRTGVLGGGCGHLNTMQLTDKKGWTRRRAPQLQPARMHTRHLHPRRREALIAALL